MNYNGVDDGDGDVDDSCEDDMSTSIYFLKSTHGVHLKNCCMFVCRVFLNGACLRHIGCTGYVVILCLQWNNFDGVSIKYFMAVLYILENMFSFWIFGKNMTRSSFIRRVLLQRTLHHHQRLGSRLWDSLQLAWKHYQGKFIFVNFLN